ncbi:gamma-glutamyltransferase [Azoarcus indigens]|uniref:Glutathione hydrolase proenzyme n=1 Tax=Azoarcus indigens TaxID=29545 RepID=A0A4R6E142_9RHOO|nr:gamma-glutamyltransferase [Azoarcus indigens]TDN51435.1 gamma-glutamyltransferase 1 [Azoarcus indigens]
MACAPESQACSGAPAPQQSRSTPLSVAAEKIPRHHARCSPPRKTRFVTPFSHTIHRPLLALVLALSPLAAPASDESRHPEPATAAVTKVLVRAQRHMVAAAHPLAAQAGLAVLRQGGSAVDAGIAMQLVLNLVEPQSSGIGGGGFLLHWQAADRRLSVIDGRETAPAAAREDRFVPEGRALPFRAAMNSGLSVGTPGLLRALEMAHRQHGRLPWAALFAPAVALAEEGFAVSPRLHALIAATPALAEQPSAAAYFLDGEGRPWPVGHRLRNPALAEVLRRVAAGGADAFYRGDIADDIVAAVRAHPRPGDLAAADLAGYRALQRPPLCGNYRGYRLCGPPPPTSGPLAVLQMLGMLEPQPMARLAPDSVQAVHYFAEAGRLAYADRERYVADPDFVAVPVAGLLAADYLATRAALISPRRSMGRALPGLPAGAQMAPGEDATAAQPSTSHLVAVDGEGNALSMTTTIEAAFGSKIFVRGFLLNNQLTDFSLLPRDAEGRPIANRVQPGKRPRSAMAPMVVFRGEQPYLLIGSPGGSAIINYVAKTLVGVLDWGLDVQQAIALPNMGSRNRQTELEHGSALVPLADGLRSLGHTVNVGDQPSGLHGILIDESGLSGGADPRREGVALGD